MALLWTPVVANVSGTCEPCDESNMLLCSRQLAGCASQVLVADADICLMMAVQKHQYSWYVSITAIVGSLLKDKKTEGVAQFLFCQTTKDFTLTI